nr:MAG TPA: hypothetical protein [Caudoviricetes sp.]
MVSIFLRNNTCDPAYITSAAAYFVSSLVWKTFDVVIHARTNLIVSIIDDALLLGNLCF